LRETQWLLPFYCGSPIILPKGISIEMQKQKEKTLSEQLFEQLCDIRSVRFEPIPQIKDFRTADYRIWLSDTDQVIAEVKQMDWNKDDLRLIENISKGKEIPSGFRTTGHIRIRNIITNAHTQLKNSSEGLYPAIIVVYDNTEGLSHLNYEDILNGMYGDETVLVDFSQDAESETKLVGHHFGGNRKLTPYHNRVVSAIALLNFISDMPNMYIFHNIHTEILLKPELAWQIADKQFTIHKDVSTYQYWSEIKR
jgi:hypothetical protein